MTDSAVSAPIVYSTSAFNYATESTNRIHGDEEARRYGFRGGLVPGVAVYAYLSRPAIDRWGARWLESGWMQARFRQPVYDGDRVAVGWSDDRVGEAGIEIRDSSGVVCAVGRVGRAHREAPPVASDYPRLDPPAPEARPPASFESLAGGTTLGALRIDGTAAERRADWTERWGESGRLPEGVGLHPAAYPDLGNRILDRNVLLGPWIHVESVCHHHAMPAAGEPLEVRARVTESFEKKGHEITVLDVAFFGEGERPLARLSHSAIFRPRPVGG